MSDPVRDQLEKAAWHISRMSWRQKREDAILDAYIRSARTGRSYAEERDLLFRERGLGKIDD